MKKLLTSLIVPACILLAACQSPKKKTSSKVDTKNEPITENVQKVQIWNNALNTLKTNIDKVGAELTFNVDGAINDGSLSVDIKKVFVKAEAAYEIPQNPDNFSAYFKFSSGGAITTNNQSIKLDNIAIPVYIENSLIYLDMSNRNIKNLQSLFDMLSYDIDLDSMGETTKFKFPVDIDLSFLNYVEDFASYYQIPSGYEFSPIVSFSETSTGYHLEATISNLSELLPNSDNSIQSRAVNVYETILESVKPHIYLDIDKQFRLVGAGVDAKFAIENTEAVFSLNAGVNIKFKYGADVNVKHVTNPDSFYLVSSNVPSKEPIIVESGTY